MSKGRRSIALFGCVRAWAADKPSSVTFKLDFSDDLETVRLIRGRNTGEKACGNSPLSISALYGSLQSVTIPDTVHIQFSFLLRMST